MAPRKHHKKRGTLSLVCPHCQYSLEGLALDGKCPECGQAYDETMLRAGKKRATPRWVYPVALVLSLLWGAGVLAVYASEFGMSDAILGFAFSFAGFLPSLAFVLGVAQLMGWLRGPNSGGVVAGFGLGGLLLGGLAVLSAGVLETTRLNELMVLFLPVYQAQAMLGAMAIGVVIALVIPPSGRRRGAVSCAAILRKLNARRATRFAKDNESIARPRREQNTSNESEVAPEPEQDD